MAHLNVHDYPEVSVDEGWQMTGDRILVAWEEKKNELLGGKLILSSPSNRQHYTGTVLAKGPLVSEEIKVGHRIAFDQFSNFEKWFDPKYGRLAMIEENRQGACFCIVPKRKSIDNGELDYDYSA